MVDPTEKTKNRFIMWQQFMYRASTRRRSLTVDDWLGFCEIPAADSIYSNGFVRLWPADDPAPPESCQQLIAHLAHECADAIRAAAVDPRDTVHQHVDELAAFARKYERAKERWRAQGWRPVYNKRTKMRPDEEFM